MKHFLITLGTLAVMMTGGIQDISAQWGSDSEAARREREHRRQEMQREMDAMRAEFDSYATQARQEYEDYAAQARREFEQFANGVMDKWGGDSIVDNTQKRWVEYSDDFTSRSVVDFETGNVEVSVLIDEADFRNATKVDAALSKAIDGALASRATTNPYRTSVDATRPLTDKPVLDGLVDMSRYAKDVDAQLAAKGKGAATATPQQRKQAATAVVKQAPRQTQTVKGNDGKQRREVTVRLPLVKDNISKNAALYKDIVAKYSQKYSVEQPLIFAIIEQESAFNPQAKSHVPAYGLMQLVPKSGGRDAYRKVTGRDEVPHTDYLYNPENNIQLGTAYLRILLDQFGGVTDADCRRICAIAAYNTGAGNVSRAFTGATKLKPAIIQINTLDYKHLYDYLTKHLAYEEARNYVSGVSRRREKYLKQ